jgi:hypothetical protein
VIPLKTTPIFNELWRFAAERHKIWCKRQKGEPAPWTASVPLQHFRFTNCFRALDRTTQYLLREVIPYGSASDQHRGGQPLTYDLSVITENGVATSSG